MSTIATVIDCCAPETKSVVSHTYPSTSIIEDLFKVPFTYGSVPPVTSNPYIHIGIQTPVPVAGALQFGSLHSYCPETFYVLVPKDADSLTIESVVMPKSKNFSLKLMGEHESIEVKHGMIIITVVKGALYAITVITSRNVIHGSMRKLHWLDLLVVIKNNVQKLWNAIYPGGIDAFTVVYKPDRVHASYMESGYIGVPIVEKDEDLPKLTLPVKRERPY